MSLYDNDASWSTPGRQPSWEQQPPPSRSGAGSAMSSHGETNAFASQFEEIDRATDNLMRSGKWAPGAASAAAQAASGSVPASPARRDSMPPMGRGVEYGGESRAGGPSRHHSVTEYEGGRPGSAGLQGYYAGQRFPGGRQSEAEQMLQAKRRMAAQRERELRNYHQEQQYNRTVSGVKTDRALSPNTMSEGDRRELIARQHRALYGDNSALYNADGSPVSHPPSQDARVTGAGHGSPPSALDRFGVQAQPGADGAVQMPPRDRTNLTASPVSTQPTQQSFGRLNDAQQSSRTSNSSSGGSPPLGHGVQKGSSAAGIIPIGTRPTQPPSSAGGGLNKRSTTPLTPSSLSHGFSSAAESQSAAAAAHVKDERSASAASNPALADKSVGGLGGWGSNSAVWGAPKTTLAVQPSVWG